ncbi:MAG: glycerate kinase [Bacteroidales bacterium]|nr:MAG: glycerate kinase [Bacteroidales bacterium]
MNILIAPDSYKDCLSSRKVAQNIEIGIRRIMPEANIKILPMADGGEGTVEALVDATGGKIIKVEVHDPLMRKIESFFGILGDRKTAVIEMAAASGIELLKEDERNPWITTTFGTGELIQHALDMGCRKFVIGIGGSATTDGGIGMAQALGGIFKDSRGKQIGYGGGTLDSLTEIDLTKLDERLKKSQVLVACDVDNPLYGPQGAAFVYSPQKGADKEMVRKLDDNLRHYANIIRVSLGIDIQNIKGLGAAGGLGAALMVFLKAELSPGFEIVKDIVKLEKEIERADIVITGEGRIDYQTQFGKTPFGVAQAAAKFNKPVIAIAGALGERIEELYEKGFESIVPVTDKFMDIEYAMKNAGTLIQNTAERTFKLLLLKKGYNI